VGIHTQVLRAAPRSETQARPLDTLRQEFSILTMRWDRAAWELPEAPPVRPALLDEVLARKGVVAEVKPGEGSAGVPQDEREFLARTYLLGTRVEMADAGGNSAQALLAWVSTHRSLYLFKREGDGGLVICSCAALLKALRDETMAPLEYAPVFERAVDSLLFGAERLQA
jgi:hypothetical protein